MKLFFTLLLCSSALFAQTKKVLIIGDSWARQQFTDGVHEQIFVDSGYGNFEVVGINTAIDGKRASDWAQADQLQIIADELTDNPDIDTVQLTIGGNDFLGEWHVDLNASEVAALQQQILTDIATITDFVLAQDSSIEILLSFYDHPNFVDTISGFSGILCKNKLQVMGSPSAFVLNTTAQAFENVYTQISANNPRVFHISHLGMMQAFYGFPDAGFAPGDIMPPGDFTRPSPVPAMRETFGITDCFHLNSDSYTLLVQNLFNDYFHARFDTIFKNRFE